MGIDRSNASTRRFDGTYALRRQTDLFLVGGGGRKLSSPFLEDLVYTYLASPYSDPAELVRLRRFRQVRRAAGLFVLAGVPVYSPIVHGHTVNAEIADLIPEAEAHDTWLSQCTPLVRGSAQIVVLTLEGWEDSRGVAREIGLALDLGIPVRKLDYFNINGRFSEAITYIRDQYSVQPPAPGVRPGEAPRLDGVDPNPRPDAPDSSPR